jgi:hypothetical protein
MDKKEILDDPMFRFSFFPFIGLPHLTFVRLLVNASYDAFLCAFPATFYWKEKPRKVILPKSEISSFSCT